MASELNEYALTTLEEANYYLGLTGDSGEVDNYIERIINRASDIIESTLNRKFKARLYVKERYNGGDRETLFLNNYPITGLAELDNLEWDSASKKVIRDDGGSFIDDGFVAGDKVLVQESDNNSGLKTIAVDGVSDSEMVFEEDITVDSGDDDVTISTFRELRIDGVKIDGDNFIVDIDNVYYHGGFRTGHKNVRLTFKAGYEVIPDDIEEYCLKLIKKIYGKDKDVKAESVGPHKVEYFDRNNIESIRKELSTYINVVI